MHGNADYRIPCSRPSAPRSSACRSYGARRCDSQDKEFRREVVLAHQQCDRPIDMPAQRGNVDTAVAECGILVRLGSASA